MSYKSIVSYYYFALIISWLMIKGTYYFLQNLSGFYFIGLVVLYIIVYIVSGYHNEFRIKKYLKNNYPELSKVRRIKAFSVSPWLKFFHSREFHENMDDNLKKLKKDYYKILVFHITFLLGLTTIFI